MSREHLTTVTRTQYIRSVDETRIVVFLKGEVPVQPGDPITVTTKEGK